MNYFKKHEERLTDIKKEVLNILNKEFERINSETKHTIFSIECSEFEVYFQGNAFEVIIECRNNSNLNFIMSIDDYFCQVSTEKRFYKKQQILQIYEVAEKIQYYLQNMIDIKIDNTGVYFSEDNFKTCKPILQSAREVKINNGRICYSESNL